MWYMCIFVILKFVASIASLYIYIYMYMMMMVATNLPFNDRLIREIIVRFTLFERISSNEGGCTLRVLNLAFDHHVPPPFFLRVILRSLVLLSVAPSRGKPRRKTIQSDSIIIFLCQRRKRKSDLFVIPFFCSVDYNYFWSIVVPRCTGERASASWGEMGWGEGGGVTSQQREGGLYNVRAYVNMCCF